MLKTLAGSLLLLAAAGSPGAWAETGQWEYGLRIYAWLPDVSGTLNYTRPGGGGDVEADADAILDALKMTFMGSFEARKGQWSAFTDVIYLDLGDSKSKSVSLPSGNTVTLMDADLDLKAWVWTLGGAYSVWQHDASHLDLLAGARLLSLDTDLELTGGGPLQADVELSASENLWDGIVGVKGDLALNDRWYLPYYADVGTGDTDLTYALAAGVGYRFKWGGVVLQYRYLKYDQDDEGLIKDISFGGPLLGINFRF